MVYCHFRRIFCLWYHLVSKMVYTNKLFIQSNICYKSWQKFNSRQIPWERWPFLGYLVKSLVIVWRAIFHYSWIFWKIFWLLNLNWFSIMNCWTFFVLEHNIFHMNVNELVPWTTISFSPFHLWGEKLVLHQRDWPFKMTKGISGEHFGQTSTSEKNLNINRYWRKLKSIRMEGSRGISP